MPNLATHIHFAMKSLPESIDQELTPIYLLGATTVSYTHLRAHET